MRQRRLALWLLAAGGGGRPPSGGDEEGGRRHRWKVPIRSAVESETEADLDRATKGSMKRERVSCGRPIAAEHLKSGRIAHC